MSTSTAQSRLTGKHVLLILLGCFAVIGTVNATFVYYALSTKPGEEKGASYEVGLRYNNILAQEHSQTALGWSHVTEIAKGERLRVAIVDKAGSPVAGLSMTGDFSRPATDKDDRNLVFQEINAGVYEAPLGAVAPGSWVLSFVAEKGRRGGEPDTYRVKERLWLSPLH